MKIASYLEFNGNGEEAFNTYKRLFDAEEVCFHRFSEKMTEDEKLIGKVFHAELRIKGYYIYLSDTLDAIDHQHSGFKLVVECDSLDEAQRYFNQLAEDGEVLIPFAKMPWGIQMGEVRDAFGVKWNFVFC